jgi:DNA-binding protein HU-beta
MNKSEFIEALADRCDLNKSQSGRCVDAFIAIITERLKKGEKVALTGFGTFQLVKRAARKARNPRTGEPVKVPASKQPRFAAGATLKAAFNPKKS